MQEHVLESTILAGVEYKLILKLYQGRVQGYRVSSCPVDTEGTATEPAFVTEHGGLRGALDVYDVVTLAKN